MGMWILGVIVVLALLGGIVLWRQGNSRTEDRPPARRDARASERGSDAADDQVQRMVQILVHVDHALLWYAMDKGRNTPEVSQNVGDNLSKVLSRLDEGVLDDEALPRRPQLLPQLMSTLNAPGSNATALAAIIGQDPALSATLMRIANSAAYRRRHAPLDSLERVVVKVGNEGIERLLASALVQPVMVLDDADLRRMASVLWRHGQIASTASADHARLVERIDPLPLHLGALLPALSNLLVMRSLPRLCNKPLSDEEQWQLLVQAQYPLAARIARRWELPESVVQALASESGPVAQSLYFGRRFAWAWMQVEQGLMDDASARQALSAHAPLHVVDWVWQRQREAAAQ